MSVARQMVEVVIASVLAVAGILLTALVAPSLAQTVGIIVACGYYFSRYPWGSRQPEGINESIDAFYDRVLPF